MHIFTQSSSDFYAIANLDNEMDIDWSTIVGSVVYTVQVKKMPENIPAMDLVLEIDPPMTAFRLNEANNYEIVVNECLVYITYYDIVVKITNDSRCLPGTLSLITTLATPVYNMPTTELTATPNEDPFQLFTEAFTIEILNYAVFGGCAAFSCTVLCKNSEGQDFLVDTNSNLVEARKSTLTLGFTYDLKVTCLDDIKNTFVTPAHSIYVKITFYPETTSPEQTTPTAVTSTSLQTTTPEPTTSPIILMQTTTHVPTPLITTPVLVSTPEPTTPTTTMQTRTPEPTTPKKTSMLPSTLERTTTPIPASTFEPTTPTTTSIQLGTPEPTIHTTTQLLSSTPDPSTPTTTLLLTNTPKPTIPTTTPRLTSTPYPTTTPMLTSTTLMTITPDPTSPTTSPIHTSTLESTTPTTHTTTPIQRNTSTHTSPITSTTTAGQTRSVPATSATHISTSTSTLPSTISATTSNASVATTQYVKKTSLQMASAATRLTPTQLGTTACETAFSAGNGDFFSKPEIIVTVVLPAVAFGSATLFGLGYILRKKFKKSNVEPVVVA